MSTGTGTGTESGGPLQFDRVELATPAAASACGRCSRGITGEYFAIAGGIACPDCVAALKGSGGLPALMRALLFGGAAAVLGTIVWFAIIKITDREFGLIAIGIGLLVGYGVRRGAAGRGGWKYQTLAMALTYVSITAAYVPMVLKGLASGAEKESGVAQTGDAPKDGDTRAPGPPDPAAAAPADADKAGKGQPVGVAQMALAFAVIFAVAFASPFLAGAENIMGLIIIGIALYEAWKINRRVPITGPFQLGAAPVTRVTESVVPAGGPAAPAG